MDKIKQFRAFTESLTTTDADFKNAVLEALAILEGNDDLSTPPDELKSQYSHSEWDNLGADQKRAILAGERPNKPNPNRPKVNVQEISAGDFIDELRDNGTLIELPQREAKPSLKRGLDKPSMGNDDKYYRIGWAFSTSSEDVITENAFENGSPPNWEQINKSIQDTESTMVEYLHKLFPGQARKVSVDGHDSSDDLVGSIELDGNAIQTIKDTASDMRGSEYVLRNLDFPLLDENVDGELSFFDVPDELKYIDSSKPTASADSTELENNVHVEQVPIEEILAET